MSKSTSQSDDRSKTKRSQKLEKLEQHVERAKERFHDTHAIASQWLKSRSLDLDQLRHSSQQALAAASIVGSLAVHQPVEQLLQQQLTAVESHSKHSDDILAISVEEHQSILEKMVEYVNRPPGHLPEQEELYLEQQLSDMLGFSVSAELDGHRLNHSIGIMGGEQHLQRFPGDTLSQHDAYQEAGIAPGRGAFGWFTENGILTDQAVAREKYYFAVQTLYLPDWNTNHADLKPWYKFRKMIAINPAEQVAVVGVVGDAGPAQWVNKQFGGSPEVIREGKIWSSQSRGKVLLFFVDDPDDTIPLGVINLSADELFATRALAQAQP